MLAVGCVEVVEKSSGRSARKRSLSGLQKAGAWACEILAGASGSAWNLPRFSRASRGLGASQVNLSHANEASLTFANINYFDNANLRFRFQWILSAWNRSR